MSTKETIIMYGTTWCPDCRRAKKFFDKYRIPYEWINISDDPESQVKVEKMNNGMRVVPTILFPDGDIMTEPSNRDLRNKFGI